LYVNSIQDRMNLLQISQSSDILGNLDGSLTTMTKDFFFNSIYIYIYKVYHINNVQKRFSNVKICFFWLVSFCFMAAASDKFTKRFWDFFSQLIYIVMSQTSCHKVQVIFSHTLTAVIICLWKKIWMFELRFFSLQNIQSPCNWKNCYEAKQNSNKSCWSELLCIEKQNYSKSQNWNWGWIQNQNYVNTFY